jgi:putative ATP-binding cassette transporter
VLGSLAGLSYAFIIPLILKSIQETPLAHKIEHIFDINENGDHFHLFGLVDISTPGLALAFFVLCIFILVCRATSHALLSRIAIESAVTLRKHIYHRITRLPIEDLERIGPSRLLTALNNDVAQLVGGAAVFPGLFTSIATLLGLLGFLIYLDISIFLFVIGMILFGAITYQIPVFFGRKFMLRARRTFDGIQEGMRGLIYGAKELKLNEPLRTDYLTQNLDACETQFSADQKRGETLIIFGMTYGDLISFFAIGVVTYAMANYYAISRENLIGVIMVMLYITAPIVTLLNAVGPIVQGSVAGRKLQALLDSMPVETTQPQSTSLDWSELTLKDVEFNYSPDSKFRLRPVNLTLKKGEVTFLVGGNGSGKTTLGKILSLHYLPHKGSVYFDDTEVTNANRDICRKSISAIYSDFYLFTKLFGISTTELDALATRYLRDLELDESVSIRDGRFSTTALSDGQKKRLALLVTYLEDRQFYLFDEWAADQDPAFKKTFYYQILPSLKMMNKMVVVISHDDRYFHLADKVIRMEDGRVVHQSLRSDTGHSSRTSAAGVLSNA